MVANQNLTILTIASNLNWSSQYILNCRITLKIPPGGTSQLKKPINWGFFFYKNILFRKNTYLPKRNVYVFCNATNE